MQLTEAVHKRRMVRNFTADPVDSDALDRHSRSRPPRSQRRLHAGSVVHRRDRP